MTESNRAKLVLVIAGGVLTVVSAIAYLGRGGIVVSISPESPTSGLQEPPSTAQADVNDPSGQPLPLGRFGCNDSAPPPVIFWGPPPQDPNHPDLSTPAAAMQTIVSLVDQGATDKLASCVLEETDCGPDGLYPRYLGQPVGLVEVVEEDDWAAVVWEAAVHTEFTLQGKRWSAGQTMTVTSRLVRVDGFWRLMQWHDGGEDGEERSQSAN